MAVVYDDEWLVGSLRVIYSDRGGGGERFSSKLRNSRRNEKFDLPCISVWDRAVSLPSADCSLS